LKSIDNCKNGRKLHENYRILIAVLGVSHVI